MAEPSLDSLLKISFETKKDLERYCRNLTVSSDDFFKLVLACELSGTPFLHAITNVPHGSRIKTGDLRSSAFRCEVLRDPSKKSQNGS